VQACPTAIAALLKHATQLLVLAANVGAADAAESRRLMHKLADLGHDDAAYLLWYAYQMGDCRGLDGVDLRAAAPWFHKAIELESEAAVAQMTEWGVKSKEGDNQSQLYLGLMHASKGRYEDAIAMWKKALKNGAIDAGVFLGECYERGEGVSQNVETAVDHFVKAAGNGSELARAKFEALGYTVTRTPVSAEST
jgi:TPR repeat protein